MLFLLIISWQSVVDITETVPLRLVLYAGEPEPVVARGRLS